MIAILRFKNEIFSGKLYRMCDSVIIFVVKSLEYYWNATLTFADRFDHSMLTKLIR